MSTHIAGPDITIQDRFVRQRCGWCGHMLIDYDLERIAVPLGQDPAPSAWPLGALVTVDGPMSYTVKGLTLPDDACTADVLTRKN